MIRKVLKKKIYILKCCIFIFTLVTLLSLNSHDEVKPLKSDSICHCKPIQIHPESKGHCSDVSTGRGVDQQVLSFTIYYDEKRGKSSMHRKYWDGIAINAHLARTLFPNYVMRLYFDMTKIDTEKLCPIFCSEPNLDLCPIDQLSHLPLPAYDYIPTAWRFLPALDPLVSEWHSRDLDSSLSEREKAAVNDWKFNSNKTFHFMRDHPQHSVEILAGMFGMRINPKNRRFIMKMFGIVMEQAQRHISEGPGRDQYILAQHVWPNAKQDSISHDSYNCQKDKLSNGTLIRAFPTKRKHNERENFIGSRRSPRFRNKECPIECRPEDHTDWKFC